MNERIISLTSPADALKLEAAIFLPEGSPRGIVQFSHGMAEHKERYFPFMKFLTEHGFITVIHDHRGHGASISEKEDLGFFYTLNPKVIAEDLFFVTSYIKKEYPGLPVFLFSHSMGTLVARVFLQTHDNEVEKVVLCGPPTKNPLAPLGILLVSLNALLFGTRHRSRFINQLTFGSYVKKGEHEKAWVCSDPKVLERYTSDTLCGYIFTDNGFLNLYGLMKQAFHSSSFQVKNKDLPLLLMAGGDDPVIQSREKFDALAGFLSDLGYENVSPRIYPGLRHELLNEIGKEAIWEDVLHFFEN